MAPKPIAKAAGGDGGGKPVAQQNLFAAKPKPKLTKADHKRLAALKIQSHARGHRARALALQRERHVVRLQSVARGRQLRQKKAAFEFEYKATRACIRIQSAFRARRSRKHVNAKRHARQEKEKAKAAKEAEAAKKAAKAQKKAQKKAEGEGGGAGNSREPSPPKKEPSPPKGDKGSGGFKPGKGSSPPQSPPKPGSKSPPKRGPSPPPPVDVMSSPDIGS